VRIGLAIVAGVLLGQGCYSWSRAEPGTGPLRARGDGRVVRVLVGDTMVIPMRYAAVDGDSLVGVSVARPGIRTAIALRDVRGVEQREFDVGRTLGLTAGILAAIVAAAAVLFAYALSSIRY